MVAMELDPLSSPSKLGRSHPRLHRGKTGDAAADPLVLPDLMQLIPSLRPHRGANLAEQGLLDAEWQHAQQGQIAGPHTGEHIKTPTSPQGGAAARKAAADAAAAVPPAPLAAAKRVKDTLKGVDLSSPAGREWLGDIVRAYEIRIEALEEELRFGCVGHLRAELLAREVDAQRRLRKRQERAVMAMQDRCLAAKFESDGTNSPLRRVGTGFSDNGQSRAAVEQLALQLKVVTQDRDDLKGRYESRTRDLLQAREELIKVNLRLTETQEVLEAEQRAREETEVQLVQERNEWEEERGKLKKRLEDLQLAKARADDEVVRQRQRLADELRQAEARLKQELADASQQAQTMRKQLEAEVAGMRTELSVVTTERDRLEKRVTDAEERAALVNDFRTTVDEQVGRVEAMLATPEAQAAARPPPASPPPILCEPDMPGRQESTASGMPRSPGRKKGRKRKSFNPSASGASDSGMRRGSSVFPAGMEEGSELDFSVTVPEESEPQLSAFEKHKQKVIAAMMPASLRRMELEASSKRLRAVAEDCERLISQAAATHAMLAEVTAKHKAARREAELLQTKLTGVEAVSKAEIARLKEEKKEQDEQLQRLALKFEEVQAQVGQLQPAAAAAAAPPDPDLAALREKREREIKEQRKREKEMHLNPDLGSPFRRFLTRMEESRKKTETRWQKKRTEIIMERTRNLQEAMDYCAAHGIEDISREELEALFSRRSAEQMQAHERFAQDPRAAAAPAQQMSVGGAEPGAVPAVAPEGAASGASPRIKNSVADVLRPLKAHRAAPQVVVDVALDGACKALGVAPGNTVALVQAWLRAHATKAQLVQAALASAQVSAPAADHFHAAFGGPNLQVGPQRIPAAATPAAGTAAGAVRQSNSAAMRGARRQLQAAAALGQVDPGAPASQASAKPRNQVLDLLGPPVSQGSAQIQRVPPGNSFLKAKGK
eukprot:TRINITY_DN26068_c0_g1_i1.p1 TRINITY_DN26068_c0_g1~~TRINITY_DN26068_c0_g1_i1.p1  ORF type:complete len:975 (+),score=382.82 TRINITY_DN26068_c0_g1_i1:81-2927(+)